MDNKRKKNKKVLVAAMVVALIIVMGATFAVFTSKDEVTNRLSSEADYNVVVTENYTPVENMTPGTTVTKEVAAVNTGAVDAFVKMTISGQLELTTMDATGDSTYSASSASSYVTLSSDEVTSLQAGAILAYTTNTNDANNVGALYTNGTDFTPNSNGGYYVFARSVEVTSSGTLSYSWEYVGYYYDGTNYYEITVDTTDSTINSDGMISGTSPSLTIDKTTTSLINATSLTFTCDSNNGIIIATYDPDSSSGSGDEIIININLATDYTNNWDITVATDSQSVACYYRYVLASSATSSQLIASVELDDSVQESAYISFNFDLDIALDSIQVAADDDDTTNGGYAATVNTTSDTATWVKKASGVWVDTGSYSYANDGDSATSITWSTR